MREPYRVIRGFATDALEWTLYLVGSGAGEVISTEMTSSGLIFRTMLPVAGDGEIDPSGALWAKEGEAGGRGR